MLPQTRDLEISRLIQHVVPASVIKNQPGLFHLPRSAAVPLWSTKEPKRQSRASHSRRCAHQYPPVAYCMLALPSQRSNTIFPHSFFLGAWKKRTRREVYKRQLATLINLPLPVKGRSLIRKSRKYMMFGSGGCSGRLCGCLFCESVRCFVRRLVWDAVMIPGA